MAIKVVYLGKLAEIAGRDESELVPSSGVLDWADLAEMLRIHVNPQISDALCDERTVLALNGAVLPDKHSLEARHGDEVALLPPVSGG